VVEHGGFIGYVASLQNGDASRPEFGVFRVMNIVHGRSSFIMSPRMS
jgi:hypothetical protein